MFDRVETLAQSQACWMDTQETPATKDADTAAPQRALIDICALAMPKAFQTQEEMVLLLTDICPPLLPNNKEYT